MFHRIVSGRAILSMRPLAGIANAPDPTPPSPRALPVGVAVDAVLLEKKAWRRSRIMADHLFCLTPLPPLLPCRGAWAMGAMR